MEGGGYAVESQGLRVWVVDEGCGVGGLLGAGVGVCFVGGGVCEGEVISVGWSVGRWGDGCFS